MNIYDNYNIDTIRNVHSHISAVLIGIFYLLLLRCVVVASPSDLLLPFRNLCRVDEENQNGLSWIVVVLLWPATPF